MRRRVILLSLLFAVPAFEGVHAAAPDALGIDLGDPEPAGLDLLPGISEEEVAAIAMVAGPGPADLEERLSQTGLSPERLREWVPYLVLPGSSGFEPPWTFRSSLRGEGGQALDSRIRVAVGARRTRGSCGIAGRPENADLTGWVGVSTPACNLTAGSISCGLAGDDPWDDPMTHLGGRSTTISPPALRSREKRGSRGVVLDRGGIGGIGLWHDRTAGEGLAVAAGVSRGFGIMGGGSARAGEGLAVRLGVGEALLLCAVHLPRESPPSFVLDAATHERTRGRIRVIWSRRPRDDGRQGKVEGAASGRVGTFHWVASGAAFGPARPKRSSILGDFGIDRSGRKGSASLAVSWNKGASTRLKVGRAFPIPSAGLVHLDSSMDLDPQRGCRVQARLTWSRGPLRFQGSPPALACRRFAEDRAWKWMISIEQKGGK